MKNCYVAARLNTLPSDTSKKADHVGGIVGASCSQSKTFENCQFDGIITGDANNIGLVLGRYLTPATLNHVVVTGTMVNADQVVSKYMGTTANNGLELNDCHNAIPAMHGTDGMVTLPAISATTDFTALLATGLWSKESADLYPVLSIAAPYLTESSPAVTGRNIDFTWYDLSNEMTIATEGQLDGLAFLCIGIEETEYLASVIRFELSLTPTLLDKYSDEIHDKLMRISDVDFNVNDDLISVEFAQIATEANVSEKPSLNGTYNIRVVAKISDESFQGVKFNYSLSQNGGSVQEAESALVQKCYRKVIQVVDGNEVEMNAEDGYYVAFTIYYVNFEDVTNTEITVQVKGQQADGNVVKSSKVVIPLTAPVSQ